MCRLGCIAVRGRDRHNAAPVAGERRGRSARMNEQEQSPEEQELRNTLYRRLTRGQRRLTPARMFVYRAAVTVGWAVVKLLWRSCRVQPILGLDAARDLVRESRAVLPVYWHRHL